MNNTYEIRTDLLLKAIHHAKLNPARLAQTIGISTNTIYRILNNQTKPSFPVAYLICSFLKLSDQEIITIFFGKSGE